MHEDLTPSQRLLKHLETLQSVRTDLFELQEKAKQMSNKEAVLQAQLNIMQAIGKIKKILKIKLEGS